MGDFAARISVQEWWSGFGFWVLVVGLIGDIIVLGIPAHRGRLEKGLSVFFTAIIILGCAFEHVADNRISDLVSQEEQNAGVKIAEANKTANAAAETAGKLGVSVKTLPDFVAQKEREISGQISTFQNFSANVRGQAKAAAATATDDLAKVSTLLAQEQAVHDKVLALATPRSLNAIQIAQFAKDAKPFPGTHFDMGSNQDVEAINLVTQIGDLLKAGGWIWDPPGTTIVINVPGHPNVALSTRSGVGVIVSESQLNKFGAAAKAIAGDLRAANISADAIAVSDQLDGRPNPEAVRLGAIHIVVGSKP